MKKSHRWAVLARRLVVELFQFAGRGPGAGHATRGRRPALALLDVSRIFKNHQRFKGMMDDMKADVERAEAQVKAEREAITKLAERLQEFHKGTTDYNEMEEELAKRQADLQVQVQLQKNEFLQREAKIYHNVYQEIWQATDYFCKQNGIDMVLRFNGEPVDVDRPDSVLTYINKPVVWYRRGLDITRPDLAGVESDGDQSGPGEPRVPVRPGVPFNK